MKEANWRLLLIGLLSGVLGTDIEILQFPEQRDVVSIRENSSGILRFQIRASSLDSISIVYGVNGTSQKYYPTLAFDYRAAHSAIVAECSIDNTYACLELYIRVAGTQQVHNTTFNLVLIKMVQRRFQELPITNAFRVHITTISTSDSTKTELVSTSTELDSTSTELDSTSTELDSTSTSGVTTEPAADTTAISTPDHQIPSILNITTMQVLQEQKETLAAGNETTILIIALAVVLGALVLSCTINILLCYLARRSKKVSISTTS